MAELVRVDDEHGAVLYEGDFNTSALREISADEKADDFVAAVEARASAITSTISSVVNSVRDSFDGMATDKKDGGALSGLEVEFGLKVSGSGNWFVAKAGAEVNLNVKVTWDFTP